MTPVGGLARGGRREAEGKGIGRGEDVAGVEWSGEGKGAGARERDAIEDLRTCVFVEGG